MESLIEQRVRDRRRVILIRHADVNYFDEAGRPLPTEQLPLSVRGRAQAAELANVLADEPIDRVVTSGLERTDATARTIVGGSALELERESDLAEIRPGPLKDWAAELAATPGGIEQFFVESLARKVGPTDRFLGGEEYGAFRERVIPAYTRIVDGSDWRVLLLVAHGGTNRAILSHVLGAPLECFGRLEQDAGCINIIDVDADGHAFVRLLNYTEYERTKRGLRLTTMEQIFTQSRRAIESLAAGVQAGGREESD